MTNGEFIIEMAMLQELLAWRKWLKRKIALGGCLDFEDAFQELIVEAETLISWQMRALCGDTHAQQKLEPTPKRTFLRRNR